MSTYKKLRIAFLQQFPMCQARIHNCQLKSTDVHHMKGRYKEYVLDPSTWLSVCRNCHNWIEQNPEDSYELGFSKKRLDNE